MMLIGYFICWCFSFFVCNERYINIIYFIELLLGLNKLMYVKCNYSDYRVLSDR